MNILYLDCETAASVATYEELGEHGKKCWHRKCVRTLKYENPTEEEVAKLFKEKSALYPEFGRLICVSVGYFNGPEFRVKSFTGEEREILASLFNLIETHYSLSDCFFCGHNIAQFDIPYICKRAIINGIPIPPRFNPSGKKPWEVPFLDTMILWQHGGRDYTSLEVLCYVLGIETSKDDIDGSQTSRVFWEEKDIQRIATYCEKDVDRTARCYLKIIGK